MAAALMAATPIRRKKNSGANKPRRRAATEPPPANTPMTDEPLIGATDVALMLGVPVSWVYMKAESGSLPSYKCGHYRRFRRSEIQEYLRACRNSVR